MAALNSSVITVVCALTLCCDSASCFCRPPSQSVRTKPITVYEIQVNLDCLYSTVSAVFQFPLAETGSQCTVSSTSMPSFTKLQWDGLLRGVLANVTAALYYRGSRFRFRESSGFSYHFSLDKTILQPPRYELSVKNSNGVDSRKKRSCRHVLWLHF